jgi:hypothetical protein
VSEREEYRVPKGRHRVVVEEGGERREGGGGGVAGRMLNESGVMVWTWFIVIPREMGLF